jgi:esterase/lipase superfamily enzyme
MKRRTAFGIGIAGVIALAAVSAFWLTISRINGEPPTETGAVLFASNRHLTEASEPAERFDGRRGQMRFGRCSVGYRPIPLSENLADSVDFYVPTEFRDIQSVQLLDEEVFAGAVRAAADRPIVMFVHGYSYGFDRTCRMGAELQRMLADRAVVVMFSWPSDANPADYAADQVDVEWSVPALAGLIERLADIAGAQRLKLLAHSLGTRGVLMALDELELSGRAPPYAGHLVLLAPDFDSTAFEQRFERVSRQVERVSLYASVNDTPLRISQALHGHPRLGQAGEALTVIDGIATIDVSALGRYQPTGHEYFYHHPIAADDLVESLVYGRPPDQRAHVRSRTLDGKRYWALVEPVESSQ